MLRKAFTEITMEDVMTKDVLVVSENESVDKVCEKMRNKEIGSALVKGSNNLVTGIFTERDLLNKIVGAGHSVQNNPVGLFMTSPMKYLSSRSSFSDAFALIYKENIRHLPIIDNGKPVGMISMRDINRVIYDELGKILFS